MQIPSLIKSTFYESSFMGVAEVIHKATQLGYTPDHPEWCNFGVGQPEVGELEGAPKRCSKIDLNYEDHEYGPTNGIDSLRETIANHYNRLFRSDKSSKYTKENVSIANGGRLMLTRVCSAINNINLGYQTPDYTVYEDILSPHRGRFNPVLLRAEERDQFELSSKIISDHVKKHKLNAFLLSNPCNPTGHVIKNNELYKLIQVGHQQNCTFILDEFYSQYIFTSDHQAASKAISSAEFVTDVNKDPILIIDGLTKNFRYPGWRLSWALGPVDMIENIGRASGGIDGSPSVPIQKAAIDVLSPKKADQETKAIRDVFAVKRKFMFEGLSSLNIEPNSNSSATFYLWANIKKLPKPLNDAQTFSDVCLKHKIITIPGPCFDVNPGQLRSDMPAYKNWVRFSFGPHTNQLKMGLDRLKTILSD